jgi:DNA-directed RNA polymerase subunit RPC12/RpoP
MSETLMVTCPTCRRAFAPPLQVDRTTLEALVLDEVYRCPYCRTDSSYRKADHFHRLVVSEDDVR